MCTVCLWNFKLIFFSFSISIQFIFHFSNLLYFEFLKRKIRKLNEIKRWWVRKTWINEWRHWKNVGFFLAEQIFKQCLNKSVDMYNKQREISNEYYKNWFYVLMTFANQQHCTKWKLAMVDPLGQFDRCQLVLIIRCIFYHPLGQMLYVVPWIFHQNRLRTILNCYW